MQHVGSLTMTLGEGNNAAAVTAGRFAAAVSPLAITGLSTAIPL